MGKETKEVAIIDASLPSLTAVQAGIDDMLANRKHIIEKVKPLLIHDVDIYKLPGMTKDSLGKPGAEKLASIFHLRAAFKIDEETMRTFGELFVPGEELPKKYVAYICTLTYNGEFAGEGRGATFVEFFRNSYRMVFSQEFEKLKPTLKDGDFKGPFDGVSKKNNAPYKYWKVKEEPVFDALALNKAIKMAQKSAFVDAVIRTTGMSDLFTQDVEDMQFDADDEPAAPTPPAPNKPAPAAPAAAPAPAPAPVPAEPVKAAPEVKDRPTLIKELNALLKKYGMPQKAFCDAYQVDRMDDISDELIRKAIAAMQTRIEKGEQWRDPSVPAVEVDAAESLAKEFGGKVIDAPAKELSPGMKVAKEQMEKTQSEIRVAESLKNNS